MQTIKNNLVQRRERNNIMFLIMTCQRQPIVLVKMNIVKNLNILKTNILDVDVWSSPLLDFLKIYKRYLIFFLEREGYILTWQFQILVINHLCYYFNYRMGFNDFTLDLLVDDQEMDFLDDTPVFRPPATSTDFQKNRVLLFPGNVLSDRRLST